MYSPSKTIYAMYKRNMFCQNKKGENMFIIIAFIILFSASPLFLEYHYYSFNLLFWFALMVESFFYDLFYHAFWAFLVTAFAAFSFLYFKKLSLASYELIKDGNINFKALSRLDYPFSKFLFLLKEKGIDDVSKVRLALLKGGEIVIKKNL